MNILKKYVGVMILLSVATGIKAQDIIEVSTTSTPVSCGGVSDGTITVTVEGGSGNLNYSLFMDGVFTASSGFIPDRTYTFTGYPKGADYFIYIADAVLGTGSLGVNPTIGGPDPIQITESTTTDINCADVNDGTITVTATGEDGILIYTLNGPVTDENNNGFFAGLPTGTYNVTVSHETCSSTDNVAGLFIDIPPALVISLDVNTPVSCFEGNDGALEITPSGGIPSGIGTGYTYSWTGPNSFTSTQEDLSGLEAGDYTVEVTDGNGCTTTLGPITVDQADEIKVAVASTDNVSCNGGSDGSAAITVTGGTPAYTFLWEGQLTGITSTDRDPTGLPADTYDLTVGDALACSEFFPGLVTLTEPDPIAVVLEGTENVSCFGGSDGTADITVTGGTPPYDYTWTGTSGYTSVQDDPTGMPPGTYTLDIIDNNGCPRNFPGLFTITEPEDITAVLNSFKDVSCFGGNDGAAEVTIDKGTAPYSLRWIGDLTGHISTGENPTDLVADTYDLEVTDANGCPKVFDNIVFIDQPDDITATIVITNVDCNGAFTGEITVEPLGGTAPYTFAWTGPNSYTSASKDINTLEAGPYDLTITDAQGCNQEFNNNVVTENSAITAGFDITNLTCNGAGNGEIDVTLNGGIPPYTYSWSADNGYTNTTDLDLTGLDAGNYTLTVTDALGCIQPFAARAVTEPDPLMASFNPTNVSCFGNDDGTINVTVSGGTPVYTFQWDGPNGFNENTKDVSALAPGTYSLDVSDANGCEVKYTDEITITEPADITVLATATNVSCNGADDGTISTVTSGGTPGYTYAWTGPNSYTSDLPNLGSLEPGAYNLTVTDANNCVKPLGNVATITEPTAITATFTGQDNPDCFGNSSGTIDIDVDGGVPPYSFAWTNSAGTIVSTDEDPVGLPAGTYSLLITDNTLCTASYPDAVELTDPTLLTLSLTMTMTSCPGANDGSISATAVGGTPNYRYSMSPGGPFTPQDNFNGLSTGSYTIYTRDDNGCTAEATIVVEEPLPITITSGTAVPATCNGNLNGEITVEVEGGTPGYTFTLIPALVPTQSSGTFTGLPAGDYTVEVDDSNGCGPVPSGTITITQPPVIQFDSVTLTHVSCNSFADGEITIYISGGTPPYEYSVDNGTTYQSDSLFTGLAPGPYDVVVRDANGCPFTVGSYTVNEPTPLTLTATVTPVSPCYEDTNGAILANASGGWSDYAYSIDGINFQPDGNFAGLAAGDYTVTVRDTGNCEFSGEYTVGAPEAVTATVVKTDYEDTSLGTITISDPAGGTAPYTYSIDGTGGTFSNTTSYTDLMAGTYQVVVRDANGCMYQETVTILDIQPITMVVLAGDVTCGGLDDGTIEFQPQDAVGVVNYSIDGGATYVTTPLFENLPGDSTYLLAAYDEDGKEYSGSITINEPAPLYVFASISPANCNAFSETGGVDLSISGGTGVKTVEWSNGNTSEDLVNVVAGQHIYTVTDENGCEVIDTANIPAFVIVNANAGADTTVCAGATLVLDAIPGDVMLWEPATYLSNTTVPDPVVSNITDSIVYTYTVRETGSGFGCYDIDTVRVNVLPTYGIEVTQDTFALEGQPIQLNTVTEGNFVSYQWIPESGLDQATIPDPVATILASTRYVLLATNDYGCIEGDSVLIELVEDLTVYNAFSPNGDFINEYFEIDNASKFPDIVVQVFNRWGTRIFYSEGYSDDQRWDGTYNGKEAPVGTYYYVIIPKPDATPITGNVTIIR